MKALQNKSHQNNHKQDKNVSGSLKNVAIMGGSLEITQRYGSAGAEFLKGLRGVDNETGQVFNRSLEKISQYKVNPEYAQQNIQQQAGFAAENLTVSKKNAQAIIDKDNTRYARSEDVAGYGKNNEVVDIVATKNGKVISQSQMKFAKPETQVSKIVNGKSAKYLQNDKFEVPTEQVEEYKKLCDQYYQKHTQSAKELQQKGNIEQAKLAQEKAQRAKQLKEKISDSGISNDEAIAARQNPKLTTAKEMTITANNAGIQGAKMGAAIGGSIAAVTNVIAVVSGDKEFGEAVKDTAKLTLTSAGVGYATGFAGSTLKSLMQQSGNSTVRALSKTGMPAAVVAATIECGKSIKKYVKGEIDESELAKEMGLTATGMLSASAFTIVGQAAIPIPVLGAMIGGMVGYMLTNSFYTSFFDVLKNAQLAREERIIIEMKCAAAMEVSKQYQQYIQNLFDTKLSHFKQDSHHLFALIENPNISDDDFCSAINQFAETFGKKLSINNRAELDCVMLSDKPLII